MTACREKLIGGHHIPALLVLRHQRTVLGRRPTSQAGATDQAVLTTVGWVLLPRGSSRWGDHDGRP